MEAELQNGNQSWRETSGKFLLIREDFSTSIEEKFHADGSCKTGLPFMFLKMDETAVFFYQRRIQQLMAEET